MSDNTNIRIRSWWIRGTSPIRQPSGVGANRSGPRSNLRLGHQREGRKQAEAKLAALLKATNDGTFVEPSKRTLIEHLRDWLMRDVHPRCRPNTYTTYQSIINRHLATAPIGAMPLQQIRPSDIEHYYATVPLTPSSLRVHHAILSKSLRKAVRDRLIPVNPVTDVEHRPKVRDGAHVDAARRCWSADEARRVLVAAKDAGTQMSAFVALALDTGARKSELHGLQWSDVDFDAGTIVIARQLDVAGVTPIFGPTKTGRIRTVGLDTETLARLKTHKRAQSELKLKNRTHYVDHGLIFAREVNQQTPTAQLGQPLKMLSDAPFDRLVKAAGVRLITFHGTRHTSATLALLAGVSIPVVSARLGHKKTSQTLDTYAHALPSEQASAAAKIGGMLYR